MLKLVASLVTINSLNNNMCIVKNSLDSYHKVAVYLSSMRYSEVVDHDDVSLLPAVEHHVAPDHVSNVLQVFVRDDRSITK